MTVKSKRIRSSALPAMPCESRAMVQPRQGDTLELTEGN